MGDCTYHPRNGAGTVCDEFCNDNNDALCETETEAWRERG